MAYYKTLNKHSSCRRRESGCKQILCRDERILNFFFESWVVFFSPSVHHLIIFNTKFVPWNTFFSCGFQRNCIFLISFYSLAILSPVIHSATPLWPWARNSTSLYLLSVGFQHSHCSLIGRYYVSFVVTTTKALLRASALARSEANPPHLRRRWATLEVLLRTKQHFPHLNTRRQSGQSSLRPSTRQRQRAPEDNRLKLRDHAYLLRGSETRDITPTTSGLSAPSLLPINCTFVKIVESNIFLLEPLYFLLLFHPYDSSKR